MKYKNVNMFFIKKYKYQKIVAVSIRCGDSTVSYAEMFERTLMQKEGAPRDVEPD
jgi:hypothetical protein